MLPIKCNRINCNFNIHPNIENNGGTHCCNGCKLNNVHGPACQKKINIKYFKINLDSIGSYGLTHQISNLHVLIRYCYNNNLKLVSPVFRLEKSHNNNIELRSTLSRYYDFSKLLVNKKPFVIYKDDNIYKNAIIRNRGGNLLRCWEIFKKTSNIPIYLPYNDKIINLAIYIANKLENYLCIHVRRGDRIYSHKMDLDTKQLNILNKIKKFNIKNVYIMTNRVNEIKSLKNDKNYNIYFYTDFIELKKIKDNYFLFSIENEIMKRASKRISTFKTNKPYYNDYLTNSFGYQ